MEFLNRNSHHLFRENEQIVPEVQQEGKGKNPASSKTRVSVLLIFKAGSED